MYFGFPFPISLTMWHMAFSSVLATVCVKSGLVAADSNMTLEVYLRAVLPVALLFAGALPAFITSASPFKDVHIALCFQCASVS